MCYGIHRARSGSSNLQAHNSQLFHNHPKKKIKDLVGNLKKTLPKVLFIKKKNEKMKNTNNEELGHPYWVYIEVGLQP